MKWIKIGCNKKIMWFCRAAVDSAWVVEIRETTTWRYSERRCLQLCYSRARDRDAPRTFLLGRRQQLFPEGWVVGLLLFYSYFFAISIFISFFFIFFTLTFSVFYFFASICDFSIFWVRYLFYTIVFFIIVFLFNNL